MRQMEGMMDDLLRDSLMEMESLSQRDPNFGKSFSSSLNMAWQESDEGRVLTVSPRDPATKLDVQVHQGVITIKAETSKGSMVSQTSRTQVVPGDCDGDKVKMDGKDGQLVLVFPWRSKDSENNTGNARKPLKTRGTQVDV